MNSSFRKKTLAVIVICLMVLMSLPAVMGSNEYFVENLDGNTLYVGGNGPGNYTTIQDAVDAASDGDTIFVYAGTYYSIITISKSVTLTGEDKNNTVIDGGSSGNVVNVTADNVNITGFTVQNGGSSPRDAGIELYSVQNCNITGNTINNNTWRGIYLSYSSNNIITGNTISNSWYGIWLSYSSNNIITGNTISDSWYGIWLSYSSNNIITGNTISDSWHGIRLSYSSKCSITANTMVERGIVIVGDSLEHWNSHTIDTSNTVNGKPVYYWKNIAGGTVPAGAGQVIIANCTGVTVENQNLSNGSGIALKRSSSCNIINNTISKNSWAGIYLSSSSNSNIITGNTISNNEGGIGLFSSSDCTITGNTISGNNITGNHVYGIHLVFAFDNVIRENNFIDNNRNACFQGIFHNSWSKNYWDNWIGFGPKIICGNLLGFIPLINFDWNPASEPYVIGDE